MSRSLAALRDAHWLTQDRVAAFTRVLLVVLVGFAAMISWAEPTMKVGQDFAAFWTSAGLALEGRSADAYGEPERAAVAALLGPGRYPRSFIPRPLYSSGSPSRSCLLRRLWRFGSPRPGQPMRLRCGLFLRADRIVPAVAFPAVTVCALFGQNSLFSAALLGGSAVTLDRAFPWRRACSSAFLRTSRNSLFSRRLS